MDSIAIAIKVHFFHHINFRVLWNLLSLVTNLYFIFALFLFHFNFIKAILFYYCLNSKKFYYFVFNKFFLHKLLNLLFINFKYFISLFLYRSHPFLYLLTEYLFIIFDCLIFEFVNFLFILQYYYSYLMNLYF